MFIFIIREEAHTDDVTWTALRLIESVYLQRRRVAVRCPQTRALLDARTCARSGTQTPRKRAAHPPRAADNSNSSGTLPVRARTSDKPTSRGEKLQTEKEHAEYGVSARSVHITRFTFPTGNT